jgi:uncharacterized damage-inducible protein DinB
MPIEQLMPHLRHGHSRYRANKHTGLPDAWALTLAEPRGRLWDTPLSVKDRSFDQRRDRLNYYGATELAEGFRTVRKNTITIAQELPEEEYGFRPAPGTRTVGELLAHISLAYNFQYQVHGQDRRSSLEGFDFPSLMQRLVAEEKVQRGKDQTLEMLHSSGEQWAGWLEGLTESFLGERVEMRAGVIPSSKSRFEMILSVKEHEMHHRGQLMLIERMLGMVPHLTRAMQARMAAATGKS